MPQSAIRCAVLAILPLTLFAIDSAYADSRPELPNLTVTAKSIAADKPFLDTVSITVRGREDIDRFASTDLFSTLQDVPGLSVIGGALDNGKSFSIRGFSDSEDVSVELDGIPRDFEKYRFGTGVFIDPELLRQIEVWRQPSVRGTPGAIGGAVRAWSRNPQELIPANKDWSISAKTSYSTNNDERQVAGVAAGQANSILGGLIAVSRRRSNDITTGDGEKIANSDTDNTSVLAKVHLQPVDELSLALSYQGWRDEGLEPFDATSGVVGFFGTVRRSTEDQTFALNSSYVPNDWLTVNFNAGHTITEVEDYQGDSPEYCGFPCPNNPRVDNYNYRSTAFRLENRIQKSFGEHAFDIYVGADGLQSERESKRVTSNEAFNDSQYPNGDNLSQPSGEKSFLGAYTLARWSWKPVLLYGGLRRTEYRSAALDTAAQNIEAAGESSSLRFASTTGEFGGELYLPAGFTLFYNNATALRPPLIDEYFTQGAFSRCLPVFLGPDLAPDSGICGDLYVPEEARTRELGISLNQSFDAGRGDILLKVIDFRSKVQNPLASIGPYDGIVAQPGVGKREGLEVESEVSWEPLFTRVSYTRIRGEAYKPDIDVIDLDPDPNNERLVQDSPYFVNVPADRFSALVGSRLFNDTVEVGYRFTRVSSRNVSSELTGASQRQQGYGLHDAYILWMPTEELSFRIAGNNLGNEQYSLSNGLGGGIGTAAPGRDYTFVLTVYF